MATTKLSSKGQIIIPKPVRAAYHWEAGLELQVLAVKDGILLKPKAPFAATELQDVAGCLPYAGNAKSDRQINTAMGTAARKAWRDSD